MADYADCGFGSSGAPSAAGDPGGDGLPATAVEVESAVLEHFPEEQREDAPFPTKVSDGYSLWLASEKRLSVNCLCHSRVR